MLGTLLAAAALVVVLNWTWGRLPGEPELTGRLVRLGDTQVRVIEQAGGAAGRADPRAPGHGPGLRGVTQRFRDHRTIAYDRPGFGFSSGGYHGLAEQLATLDTCSARWA